MKMYRVWFDDLTEVEVERVTDKSVWIKGRRSARESTYERYFDTREQARAFLIIRLKNKKDQIERNLQQVIIALEKARRL